MKLRHKLRRDMGRCTAELEPNGKQVEPSEFDVLMVVSVNAAEPIVPQAA